METDNTHCSLVRSQVNIDSVELTLRHPNTNAAAVLSDFPFASIFLF